MPATSDRQQKWARVQLGLLRAGKPHVNMTETQLEHFAKGPIQGRKSSPRFRRPK